MQPKIVIFFKLGFFKLTKSINNNALVLLAFSVKPRRPALNGGNSWSSPKRLQNHTEENESKFEGHRRTIYDRNVLKKVSGQWKWHSNGPNTEEHLRR